MQNPALPSLGAALLAVACGGTDTDSHLAIAMRDDGIEYRANWTYRSFNVDVDLMLSTIESAEACASTGSLRINDVVSETDRYELAATDCSALRLTDAGDIVLQSQSTGYDWTQQELMIDTEREIVLLGPVTLSEPDTGAALTYRFTLAAPPCPDDADCDCGALKRLGGPDELSLDLGRTCD